MGVGRTSETEERPEEGKAANKTHKDSEVGGLLTGLGWILGEQKEEESAVFLNALASPP